jgi:hypothetical protein
LVSRFEEPDVCELPDAARREQRFDTVILDGIGAEQHRRLAGSGPGNSVATAAKTLL